MVLPGLVIWFYRRRVTKVEIIGMIFIFTAHLVKVDCEVVRQGSAASEYNVHLNDSACRDVLINGIRK